MRALLLVAALALLLAGDSAGRERGAFEQHLRDAIRLNQARRPLYSAGSGGRSEAVSDRLIRDERIAVPVAAAVDVIARYWQKRGIPIVSEDFISIDLAPAFESTMPNPQPLSAYRRQDGTEIAKRIRQAGKKDGFEGVCRAARAELERLESVPTYHAMVRHVLESTLRSAHLAPKHEALARSRGVASPASLSRRLIDLNLLALIGAAALDELAAPVQARGIPIIHRDVPKIDTHSDFYDGVLPVAKP